MPLYCTGNTITVCLSHAQTHRPFRLYYSLQYGSHSTSRYWSKRVTSTSVYEAVYSHFSSGSDTSSILNQDSSSLRLFLIHILIGWCFIGRQALPSVVSRNRLLIRGYRLCLLNRQPTFALFPLQTRIFTEAQSYACVSKSKFSVMHTVTVALSNAEQVQRNHADNGPDEEFAAPTRALRLPRASCSVARSCSSLHCLSTTALIPKVFPITSYCATPSSHLFRERQAYGGRRHMQAASS